MQLTQVPTSGSTACHCAQECVKVIVPPSPDRHLPVTLETALVADGRSELRRLNAVRCTSQALWAPCHSAPMRPVTPTPASDSRCIGCFSVYERKPGRRPVELTNADKTSIPVWVWQEAQKLSRCSCVAAKTDPPPVRSRPASTETTTLRLDAKLSSIDTGHGSLPNNSHTPIAPSYADAEPLDMVRRRSSCTC